MFRLMYETISVCVCVCVCVCVRVCVCVCGIQICTGAFSRLNNDF